MCNKKSIPEKTFELEKHIHEQYAINNNANISSFITFLVSILAIFVAYGYVFVFNTGRFAVNNLLVNTKPPIITNLGETLLINTESSQPLFSLDVLNLVTIASVIVLTFLAILCIYLGYAHRRDQMIVQRIRMKNYTKKRYDQIFEDDYNPRDKKCLDFLPDFYKLFSLLFISIIIILSVLSVIIMFKNEHYSLFTKLCFIVIAIALIVIVKAYCHYFQKYKRKNNSVKQLILAYKKEQEHYLCTLINTSTKTKYTSHRYAIKIIGEHD